MYICIYIHMYVFVTEHVPGMHVQGRRRALKLRAQLQVNIYMRTQYIYMYTCMYVYIYMCGYAYMTYAHRVKGEP